MKKIYLSLLSITAACGLNAQTLTQANHAPANGDTYSTTVVTGTISPGASGANQNWNYTSVALTSTTTGWSATTSTNSAFAPANVLVQSTAGDAMYFESTASTLKYYGGDLVIAGNPVTLTYTSPAVFATYPMTLNTANTNAIGGSLNAFGNPGTFTGTCSIVADATGTLALPGITFTNVIRTITLQDIRFNVLVISNGTLTQMNYDYYSAGSKQPMFTISTSTVDAPPLIAASSNTVLTIYTNYLPAGITKNISSNLDFVVYPNPAANSVKFATSGNETLNVKLFDIAGRKVEENTATGNVELNVSDLANGIYIYTLTNSDGKLSTGKVTIAH